MERFRASHLTPCARHGGSDGRRILRVNEGPGNRVVDRHSALKILRDVYAATVGRLGVFPVALEMVSRLCRSKNVRTYSTRGGITGRASRAEVFWIAAIRRGRPEESFIGILIVGFVDSLAFHLDCCAVETNLPLCQPPRVWHDHETYSIVGLLALRLREFLKTLGLVAHHALDLHELAAGTPDALWVFGNHSCFGDLTADVVELLLTEVCLVVVLEAHVAFELCRKRDIAQPGSDRSIQVYQTFTVSYLSISTGL